MARAGLISYPAQCSSPRAVPLAWQRAPVRAADSLFSDLSDLPNHPPRTLPDAPVRSGQATRPRVPRDQLPLQVFFLGSKLARLPPTALPTPAGFLRLREPVPVLQP